MKPPIASPGTTKIRLRLPLRLRLRLWWAQRQSKRWERKHPAADLALRDFERRNLNMLLWGDPDADS